MTSEWAPANGIERALAGTLRDDQIEAYVATLLPATLFLPSADEPAPQELVTLTVGDECYLMVFTSVEAMAAQLTGVPAYRTTTCAELVEKWPDERCLLAVDPGLPIQAYLPVDVLADALAGGVSGVAVPTEDDLPFSPSNEVESDLVAADDDEAVLSTLLLASVLVPVAEPTTAEPGDPDFP